MDGRSAVIFWYHDQAGHAWCSECRKKHAPQGAFFLRPLVPVLYKTHCRWCDRVAVPERVERPEQDRAIKNLESWLRMR